MRPYRLSPTGDLLTQDGAPCPDPAPATLDAGQIEVQHLDPHVEGWPLPSFN
ncbi:hypothetical protein [Tropicibacter naphthalenivorans]|uniref:hypothetical protein n=1 Tax=Tropicibacter naphthalenivorans TaxID=441103 RepID=UPI001356462B|nr:hypothetical protein [Tropicibacter naphthalenivorans]